MNGRDTVSIDTRPRALRPCARCLFAVAASAAALAASFVYLPLDLGRLFTADAARELGSFFLSFFPPDVSSGYLAKTAKASLETLAVSAVSTALAAAFGLALALPASGRHGSVLRRCMRLVLNVLRSIPELVWAALMVLAAGLGPFAGTLALAAHTSGVLGRLFSEALENAPPAPALALVEAGAAPTAAFLYGTLPGVVPQLFSYTLYRWEINIRMAAIVGFVGAGGLGQMLYFELSLLHQSRACTVIVAMLVLAAIVDGASAALRNRLTNA
jgi:phosphonate transport system permease protein